MKYAPRKVYIKENSGYVELSYMDFCRRRQADQSYMDKLFIPVQGCLLEVVREQYADFYKDKERWRYLKKLDTKNGLLSLDGFTDSEKGNQKETLKINTSKLKKYFPKNTTPKQMEDAIIKLLERELQRKRGRDSR